MGLKFEYEDGQTPLNEDEKDDLLITTITTQGELDEHEQRNIEKAIEWTIRNRFKASKILSEKFVREVHKKMFSDTWKWAGDFRQSEMNIGVEWITIPVRLRTLIDDTKYWIENDTYPPDELTVRFKHRLVNIHSQMATAGIQGLWQILSLAQCLIKKCSAGIIPIWLRLEKYALNILLLSEKRIKGVSKS